MMQKTLFIGNSHTYFNDMPDIFRRICKWNGKEMFTFMLAHGGIGLDSHLCGDEALYNIKYGGFDFVVLQDTANPYKPEVLFDAGKKLADCIHESGAVGISYMAWPVLENRQLQSEATNGHLKFTSENSLAFAPAGEAWWRFFDAHPEVRLFRDDNQHASKKGSYLAACCIYCAAFGECPNTDGEEIHSLMAKTAYEVYLEYSAKKELK